MYRLINGWRARSSDGVLKKSGELIELSSSDAERMISIGCLKRITAIATETPPEEEHEDEGDEDVSGGDLSGLERGEGTTAPEYPKGRRKG